MAIALRIISGGESHPRSAVVFDGPRVVLGRSRSCDLRLLDPTVSARHVCIRLEGGTNVITDEGSTNGLLVGPRGGPWVALPARTPRVLAPGDCFRVGRLWLSLDVSGAMASPVHVAAAVARTWFEARRAEVGVPLGVYLEVVAGPDAGTRWTFGPDDDEAWVGSAEEVSLRLTDDGASPHHVAIRRRGDGFVVRASSEGGAQLGRRPLGPAPTAWRPGSVLHLGRHTRIMLRDPFVGAAQEVTAAPDVPLTRAEADAPAPPGEASPSADLVGDVEEVSAVGTMVVAAPADPDPLTPATQGTRDEPTGPEAVPAPPSAWFVTMDLVVTLVALGLIAVSGFGLLYVLG
ncbi:MAG: FHA domain-containing protein [Myxococcota bacterium]